MRKGFLEDKFVYEAYDRWINGPNLLTNNYYDREGLYLFVISCVKYVKNEIRFVTKKEAWKSINMDMLEECLDKTPRLCSG